MESRVENIDSITYRRQVGNREEIWRTYWTEEWAPVSYKIADKFWIPVKFPKERIWKKLIATITMKMKCVRGLLIGSKLLDGHTADQDFASLKLRRRGSTTQRK